MKGKRGLRILLTVTAILIVTTFTTIATPRPAAGRAASANVPDPACVPDLVGQLGDLKHHGEALGFHLGAEMPRPTLDKHYQGIQRDPRPGTPTFFVSRNGNHNPISNPLGSDEPGNLLVVQLPSRDGAGERLRSNKLQRDEQTNDTAPPAGDSATVNITLNGAYGWPAYRHVGGMQLLGNLLVVPLEVPINESDRPGVLLFVDISDPNAPIHRADLTQYLTHSAGAVAVTKLSSGRILYLIGGPDGNETLFVYSSNDPTTDDEFDFRLVDRWTSGEYSGPEDWPTGTGGHQTLNFMRDCDGTLYLLGTRHTSFAPQLGDDKIDLFRAQLQLQTTGAQEFSLTHVQTRQFFCNSAAARICNFAAGAAPYVSPAGELLLYGVEHDDDGAGGSVRMGEFRNRDEFRSASPNLTPLASLGGPYPVLEGGTVTLDGRGSAPPFAAAWAEFYDDKDFLDRSVVFDWADREADDFDDFSKLDGAPNDLEEGFTDKASSVRWRAPIGCDLVLFKDADRGGDTLVLRGSGSLSTIADLHDGINPDTQRPYGFGDDVSSVEFRGTTCDGDRLIIDWDLNNDGGFETHGATATFSAAGLDGPTTATVGVHVQGAFGVSTTASGPVVTVLNVAPIATLTVTPTIDEGGTVTLTGEIDDPGAADTHSVRIDWGDGNSGFADGAGNARTFSSSHRYIDDNPTGTPADQYTIRVLVADDDGGEGLVTATVTVKNVAPVATIDAITDEAGGVIGVDTPAAIQGLPVTLAWHASDVGIADTRTVIVDWGDGTVETDPRSFSHTYREVNTYALTLTVIDDDGGRHTLPALAIPVRNAAGAAQAAVEMLRQLLADPALPPASASAIRDALARLEGANGGAASNGALDKLANGELAAALTKIEQSLGYLTAAEAANPTHPLTAPKRMLTLAARSVAVGAVAEAEKVATTPAALEKVAQARALLMEGDQRLRAGDYTGAVIRYKAAVSKAQDALTA